jgi:signal transduction histidine kinase
MEKIKQIVINICKNAVEAMPGGGVLTLKAYQLNDYVILEISDTGTGIPDGIDVFQLFKTTKADGTGLGLPIVHQIVSEHRGTIECVSERGKGATFRISLPLASSSTGSPMSHSET